MAEKFTNLTTPAGLAVYPHLHAPDTKFNPEGLYKLKLQLEPAAAQALIAKLEPEFAKAKELVPASARSAKVKPTRHEPWQEQEDGTFIFGEIKMKASGTTKDGREFTRRPFIFDAGRNALPEGTKIGGGSTVRVNLSVGPYFMASSKQYGVALYLEAVQVLDLKTWGERSADSFGFDEEDGYVAPEGSAASAFDSDDDGETAAEDGNYSAEDF